MAAMVGCLALLAAGCTGAPGSSGATRAPAPAGPTPSTVAKQVCQFEAIQDIDSALGQRATVADRTWVDHLYSCQYRYPTGTLTLSVKELSSWGQTLDYFRSLAQRLGRRRTLLGLGQGAFQTTDGSVVVRKDWKVLLVDISALPARFGRPATSSGYDAVTVGGVILGCWAGD
jgi:hypothetical protein